MRITFFSFYNAPISKIVGSTGGTDYGNHLYYPLNVFCQQLVSGDHFIVEPDDEFDVAIFLDLDQKLFDIAKNLSPNIKKNLVCIESPIYCPFVQHIGVLCDDVWDGVLTYNRSFKAKNINYYDIPVTGNIEKISFVYPDKNAKGVAVSSLKNDLRGYVPIRRDIFLKKLASSNQIDVFGGGWKKSHNIHGKTSNKLDSMRGHSFAVVIENSKYDGYVTEKLGDAILSGLPSMYYGDFKNAERRFPGTFVVLEDLTYDAFEKARNEIFNNYEHLVENVKCSFDKSEYWINSFITNIGKVLKT
jgi:hypothetical protein